MQKVIVERARYGSRDRSQKYGLRVFDQDADIPRVRPKRTKSLSETLNPLRRYLESNVGRPWDKVYSEIRANLDVRSATGLHIMQHLYQYVTRHCWREGRQVMADQGYPRRATPVVGLYVDPVTGILRMAPNRPRTARAK